MSAVPPVTFRLNPLDIMVLLYNVHRGAQFEDHVGFEDADRTLHQLTTDLTDGRIKVPQGALESALWSCNLMDEVDEFWSPTDESFDEFVSRMLKYFSHDQQLEFDKFFNQLRPSRPNLKQSK